MEGNLSKDILSKEKPVGSHLGRAGRLPLSIIAIWTAYGVVWSGAFYVPRQVMPSGAASLSCFCCPAFAEHWLWKLIAVTFFPNCVYRMVERSGRAKSMKLRKGRWIPTLYNYQHIYSFLWRTHTVFLNNDWALRIWQTKYQILSIKRLHFKWS